MCKASVVDVYKLKKVLIPLGQIPTGILVRVALPLICPMIQICTKILGKVVYSDQKESYLHDQE